MRRTFFSLMLLSASGFLFAQNTGIRFDEPVQKFGKVDEGEEVKFQFDFTNESGQPLIINETKVNCSCTKVEFSKLPVKPGENSSIHVSFKTEGKIGYQERNIEVYSNLGKSVISFKGVVKATEETKKEYRNNQ